MVFRIVINVRRRIDVTERGFVNGQKDKRYEKWYTISPNKAFWKYDGTNYKRTVWT